MKILFLMRHAGYIRHFESTLRLLSERGHCVHLAYNLAPRDWLADAPDAAKQLSTQYPNFSYGMAPVREDGWGLLGQRLRLDLDYLRYLTPAYRLALKLRRRAAQGADQIVVRGAQGGAAARWCIARALGLMDRSIPRSVDVDRFIDEQQPDLLLVTPVVRAGSPQSDYVRSAQARGVRTVFCVASWDNLTNKGLIHDRFDLVTVWNQVMKREAVELQGVLPERVAVTGAQSFDEWFGRQPSTPREAFCARVGLRPDRPYVLYVCSSPFVAPHETPFVRTWVAQLRTAPTEALRQAGVLVRPHPQNSKQWRDFDVSGMVNVAIYPAGGAVPVDPTSKDEYFDSIFHSAAVIGINTSAEIESAIVGRKVFSLLAPEFRETQEGTLHFRHLMGASDGLLYAADSFPDHLAQLDSALRDSPGDANDRSRRFVETFVRPHGVGVAATQKLVEAVEAAGARPASPPVTSPMWAPLVRPFLGPLAARTRRKAMVAAAARARRAKLKRKQHAEIARKRAMRRQQRLAASPPSVGVVV